MLVGLSAWAFDLCLTAGPGGEVSVNSCRRLISPALTQAQLIDGTLWDSARKLSGPCQINHWRGFYPGFHKLWPQWPVSLCLLALTYIRVMILEQHGTLGLFSDKCFDYPEL